MNSLLNFFHCPYCQLEHNSKCSEDCSSYIELKIDSSEKLYICQIDPVYHQFVLDMSSYDITRVPKDFFFRQILLTKEGLLDKFIQNGLTEYIFTWSVDPLFEENGSQQVVFFYKILQCNDDYFVRKWLEWIDISTHEYKFFDIT